MFSKLVDYLFDEYRSLEVEMAEFAFIFSSSLLCEYSIVKTIK
jgi:hypothetical protein